MKRVSLKVAKYIKEKGYPQRIECGWFYKDGKLICVQTADVLITVDCIAPTSLEVWLWLWREKGIKLMPTPTFDEMGNETQNVAVVMPSHYLEAQDPEEAIVAAIEYMVDN